MHRARFEHCGSPKREARSIRRSQGQRRVCVCDSTLRVRDREDPYGATADLEIGMDGQPLACRTERPRLVGKQSVPTPWFAAATAVREYEGMRIGSRTEAAWDLPEGRFTYFRAEVSCLAIIRASAPSL